MGGFSRGSSAATDNEAEVENLLSQFEEESILKLSVNSHRRTEGFQAASAAGHDPAEPGLEENLLVRFANLKSLPAAPVKKSQDLSGVNAKNRASKEPDPDADEKDREEEEADVLAADLEERLSSLKAGLYASGKGKSSASLKAPSSKFSSSSTTSSDHSSSPSSATPKSRSFSPIKFVKQLSMGKKNNSKAKSRSSEGSISSAEDDSMSDANKLLASVADQVMQEKKMKQNKLEDPTTNNNRFFAAEEDDEDDERLLKDLNLKQLKKELSKASGEEDRLTREAQQVIQWAKDATRLEAGSVVGDESDLEELLRMEDEEEEAMKKEKKKKGLKKWSLF